VARRSVSRPEQARAASEDPVRPITLLVDSVRARCRHAGDNTGGESAASLHARCTVRPRA